MRTEAEFRARHHHPEWEQAETQKLHARGIPLRAEAVATLSMDEASQSAYAYCRACGITEVVLRGEGAVEVTLKVRAKDGARLTEESLTLPEPCARRLLYFAGLRRQTPAEAILHALSYTYEQVPLEEA